MGYVAPAGCIPRCGAPVYTVRGAHVGAETDEWRKTMTDRDTNDDQATAKPEGAADQQTRGFEMPGCCGPMVERMMKAFDGAPGKEGTERDGSEVPGFTDWCKAMRAQMTSACCGPRDKDGEPRPKAQGPCCGEPG